MYSIIILAHDKAPYTRACLRSILAQDVRGVETIVLDNGSTDETPRMLAELVAPFDAAGGALRVIRRKRNVGCCTARNTCMEAAGGRYVVFMDNDTEVISPDWLRKMSDVLEEAPQNRIVGPKMCYPFEPHWIQSAGVGISKTGRVQFRGRGEAQDDPRFNRREEVQTLISACMMFDADLPKEIGGLDEVYNPIQFEDFDFCYRARSKGYRVVYTPDPVVYHWESVTSDGTAALPNTRLIIRNGLTFKRRWRHMFEAEDGPPDAECAWKIIEAPSIAGEGIRRLGAHSKEQ